MHVVPRLSSWLEDALLVEPPDQRDRLRLAWNELSQEERRQIKITSEFNRKMLMAKTADIRLAMLERAPVLLRIKLSQADPALYKRFIARGKKVVKAFNAKLKPDQYDVWLTFVWWKSKGNQVGGEYHPTTDDIYINLAANLEERPSKVNVKEILRASEATLFHEYVHHIQQVAGLIKPIGNLRYALRSILQSMYKSYQEMYHGSSVEQHAYAEEILYMRRQGKSDEQIKTFMLEEYMGVLGMAVGAPKSTRKKFAKLCAKGDYEEASDVLLNWVKRYYIKKATNKKSALNFVRRWMMTNAAKQNITLIMQQVKEISSQVNKHFDYLDYIAKEPKQLEHLKPMQFAASTKQLWLYSNDDCPYCLEAEALLQEAGWDYNVVPVESEADWNALEAQFGEDIGVPQVFWGDRCIGGLDTLQRLIKRKSEVIAEYDGKSSFDAARELEKLWLGRKGIISVSSEEYEDEDGEDERRLTLLVDGDVSDVQRALPDDFYGYQVVALPLSDTVVKRVWDEGIQV
jgi:glutaredoxin 3